MVGWRSSYACFGMGTTLKEWTKDFMFNTSRSDRSSLVMLFLVPWSSVDRPCGLVIRVRGYRSRGPGSIPGASRFSVKQSFTIIIEELFGRKSSGSGIESRGIRHADHVSHSIRKKSALTSSTSCGRSVGIIRSRTQATELL
jgi:hypothetical protein